MLVDTVEPKVINGHKVDCVIRGSPQKSEKKPKKKKPVSEASTSDPIMVLVTTFNDANKTVNSAITISSKTAAKPIAAVNGSITTNSNSSVSASNQKPSSKSVVNATTSTNTPSTTPLKKKPARSQSKKTQDKKKKFVLAKRTRRSRENGNLFNYQLYSDSEQCESSDELDDSDSEQLVRPSVKHDLPIPSIALTVDDCNQLEISKLRSKVQSQKWLLTNWIEMKKADLKASVAETKNKVESERRRSRSTLDVLFEARSKRVNSVAGAPPTVASLRKGTCCFIGGDDDQRCHRPALPFTRHCTQHILYNVDQLLFSRCSAKCRNTWTQCTNATFDVEREEPLCDMHLREECEAKEINAKENGLSGARGKRKGKALPLTKPARRKKRRTPEKGGSLDANDYQIGLDSPENVHSDSADELRTRSLSQRLLHRGNSLPDVGSSASPSQLSRISPHPSLHDSPIHFDNPRTVLSVTASHTTTSPPVDIAPHVPTPGIPSALDVGVPHLAPSDEALVASIVAQLPPLGGVGVDVGGAAASAFDAELTEVFNKIPDDAFNELFADNLKNGDGAASSHAAADAAIEQALAVAASKDNVHQPSLIAPHHAHPDALINVTQANGDSTYSTLPGLHASVPVVPPSAAVPTPIMQTAPTHLAQMTDLIHPPVPHLPPVPVGQQAVAPTTMVRPTGAVPGQSLNENDIMGLASTVFATLTTEQQQQLNGLIDGALASGSLSTSPTLKSGLNGWL